MGHRGTPLLSNTSLYTRVSARYILLFIPFILSYLSASHHTCHQYPGDVLKTGVFLLLAPYTSLLCTPFSAPSTLLYLIHTFLSFNVSPHLSSWRGGQHCGVYIPPTHLSPLHILLHLFLSPVHPTLPALTWPHLYPEGGRYWGGYIAPTHLFPALTHPYALLSHPFHLASPVLASPHLASPVISILGGSPLGW